MPKGSILPHDNKRLKTEESRNAWLQASKHAEAIINSTRDRFYQEKLEASKHDRKKTYSIVEHLVDRSIVKSLRPNNKSDEGIADEMSCFFKEKVEKIYSAIEASHQTDLVDQDKNCLFVGKPLENFSLITEQDLIDTITELNKKECESDPIPLKLLVKCLEEQIKSKKSKARKQADFVAPKFDNVNCCMNCKGGDVLRESLVCKICNTSFHAVCKTKAGTLDPKSICTQSFLNTVRPVIAKYGINAQRWGNFMFVCEKCNDQLKSFMEFKKDSRKVVHTWVNTDSAENYKNAQMQCDTFATADQENEHGKHEELITQVQTILK
ncbi:hypothetical protein ACHWQZ_G012694 [Mnemiopsis leidyi]